MKDIIRLKVTVQKNDIPCTINHNKNCFIFQSQKCGVSGIVADPSFQYILRSKDIDRKWSAWRYNERKLSSEGFTDNM